MSEETKQELLAMGYDPDQVMHDLALWVTCLAQLTAWVDDHTTDPPTKTANSIIRKARGEG